MLQKPLLRFQIYCDSFFTQDTVLAEEASRYRQEFFKRRDEVPTYEEAGGHDNDFHMILHYVFQEYKTVVRQVAYDLGIIIYPGPSDDDPSGIEYTPDFIKQKQELREALRLQRAATLLGEDTTKQSPDIRLCCTLGKDPDHHFVFSLEPGQTDHIIVHI